MSIVVPVDATVVSAADETARYNEVTTKFNAHSHEDLTKSTSNTFTIGNDAVGDKTFAVSTDDANDPALRFNTTTDLWTISNDGVTYSTHDLVTGTVSLQGTQTITGEKTFLNIVDPTTDQGAANKKYVDDNDVDGLWEVDGTETQLIIADEIDLQTKKIINVVDPAAAQDAATKNYVDSGAYDARVKAWVNFDGTTTGPVTVRDSFNVSGVVDNGVGDYTISWDTNFATVNYVVFGFARATADGSGIAVWERDTAPDHSVGSVTILTSLLSSAPTDPVLVSVMATGGQ